MNKVSVKKASITLALLTLAGIVLAMVSFATIVKQFSESLEESDEDDLF